MIFPLELYDSSGLCILPGKILTSIVIIIIIIIIIIFIIIIMWYKSV